MIFVNYVLSMTETESFNILIMMFLMASTVLRLFRSSCEFKTFNGLQKVLLLFKRVGEFGEFYMENQGLYLCYSTMV